MIDELEIHRFILAFNKRNSDDWNPSNVNLRKMLAEFAEKDKAEYKTAIIPCPHCQVNITIDSDMLTK